MRNFRSSRLKRNNERQNKKQATIFAIATIVTLFLLIQFGPLIINLFGNAVYTLRGTDTITPPPSGKTILQAPTLFNIPEATQSSKFAIAGNVAYNKGTVEIYLNDELEKEVSVDKNSNFNTVVNLKNGSNTIKARYVIDDKTSPFTSDYYVSYTTDKPELEITFPSDNSNFTRADKSITIKGKTNPESTITINGFRAIVDSDGNFEYLIQLNEGDNQIAVQATNRAGTTNDKSIKVSYHP